MTAKNKIPSEIILDEDLHSKRIADLIKVNAEKFNEALAKLEDVRKIKISDSEIYELIIGTMTTGTIAKNYYREFPPEMMLISQKGLDSALQELNLYIIFFKGSLGTNMNRYHFEFIEVQDSRLKVKTNTKRVLSEIFTLKIEGANVARYLEAQRLCGELQTLINNTGMYFQTMFNTGLYGDKLSINENVFADYSKRNGW